ncbi:MAG: FAD-dependent oxidoreductase [Nevskia sp.]|nr:FAD-dependent oxidoreductase [Nevskia sp.]
MTQAAGDAPRRVVVIGAGHGGAQLVAFLRQFGFAGSIVLVGDEAGIPYQRPPLSKAWLKGETTLDKLAMRPASFYAEQKIELRSGLRAEGIDTAARQVRLSNSEQLGYDELVLATGSYPRALPLVAAGLGNVLALRALPDAEKLRAALAPGKRLVIVGGGFIGLECAATARDLGAEVVVLEKAPRLLERVASAPISQFLHRYHEARGVTVVVDASITAVEGQGRAEAVRLADGRRFACDSVLVGIGAVPATALAEAAGLACDNGVCVGADCRSSDPHIFAIGDVARRPHPLYGTALRLESVPSSLEQARLVAAAIAGREPGPPEVPWFWSDQYDLKLQMAGLPVAVDEVVIRGQPEGAGAEFAAKFAVFHLSQGRVTCVEAVNQPQAFMAGRKLIGSGKTVPAARLADPAVPLNELAA